MNEVIRFSDMHENLQKIFKTGFVRGLSTGWPSLDAIFTVRKKEWTLLTGIPGSGKTEFLDNLVVNMIRIHQWKFALFSAENLPYERHAASLLEKFTGISLRTGLNEDRDIMYAAIQEICRNIFFINPAEENINIDRILAIAGMLKDGYDIDALIIDPWNEIDFQRIPGINETENISRSLSKIRRFARLSDLHVFVIAHPTKLIKNDRGTYPVPTPYDVSGSANFRNKADNCLSIWWDYVNPGWADIHVQKIRFGEVGMLGCIRLDYNTTTGIYSERGI